MAIEADSFLRPDGLELVDNQELTPKVFSLQEILDGDRLRGSEFEPTETPTRQPGGIISLSTDPKVLHYGFTSSAEIIDSRRRMADSVKSFKVRKLPSTQKLPAPEPLAQSTPDAAEFEESIDAEIFPPEKAPKEWEARCYPLSENPSDKDVDDRNKLLDCAAKFFDWQGTDESGTDVFRLKPSFDDPADYSFEHVQEFYDYYQQEVKQKQQNPYKLPRRKVSLSLFRRELQQALSDGVAQSAQVSSDAGVPIEEFFADLQQSLPPKPEIYIQDTLPGTDDRTMAELQAKKAGSLRRTRRGLKSPIEGTPAFMNDRRLEPKPSVPDATEVEENIDAEIFPPEKAPQEWEVRCYPRVELPRSSRLKGRRIKRSAAYEQELQNRNSRLNFVNQHYEWAGVDSQGKDIFVDRETATMGNFDEIMVRYDVLVAQAAEKLEPVEPYRDYTKRTVRMRASLGKLSLNRAATKGLIAVQTKIASRPEKPTTENQKYRQRKVAVAVGGFAAATVVVGVGAYAASKGWIQMPGGGGKQNLAQNLVDAIPDQVGNSELTPTTPTPRPTSGVLQDAVKIISENSTPKPAMRTDGIHTTVGYGDTLSGILTDNLQARGHRASTTDLHQGSQMWGYFNGQDPNLLSPGQDVFFSDEALELIIKR